MKVKITIEVDLDKTIGRKLPSSPLGFSLLHTILIAKPPTKTHKSVLEDDYGITFLGFTKVNE